MKTAQEFLQILRNYLHSSFAEYNITHMDIFGNEARGEQQEGGDAGICFEDTVSTLLL